MPVFKVYRDGTEMHNGANEKIFRAKIIQDLGEVEKIYDAIFKKYIVQKASYEVHFYDFYGSVYLFKMKKGITTWNIAINGPWLTFDSYSIQYDGNNIKILKSYKNVSESNGNMQTFSESDVNVGTLNIADDEVLYIQVGFGSIGFYVAKDVPLTSISNDQIFTLPEDNSIGQAIVDFVFNMGVVEGVDEYVHIKMLSANLYGASKLFP